MSHPLRPTPAQARLACCAPLHAAAFAIACIGPSAGAQALPEVQVLAPAAPVQGHITSYERSDLLSKGDASLSEVLRRLPGVSVDSDGYISLRGMGNGRTQVLINDLPVTPNDAGVSLDTYPLSVVERVDIVRGASASDSGAAVAGSIRIVTRRAIEAPERTARMRAGFGPSGQYEHSASVNLGGHSEQWQWQASAEVRQREQSTLRTSGAHYYKAGFIHPETGVTHVPMYGSSIDIHQSQERLKQASLAGEASLRASTQDTLRLQWLAMFESVSFRDDDSRALMQYGFEDVVYRNGNAWPAQGSNTPSWSLSPTLHWEHDFGSGRKLRTEVGTSHQRYKERYRQQGSGYYTMTGNGEYDFHHEYDTGENAERLHLQNRDTHAAADWQQALSATQTLSLGTHWRKERSSATIFEYDEQWQEPQTRQSTAGYVQWSWQPHAQWQLQTGLRHEHQTLQHLNDEGAPQRRANSLWLPSLNLSYAPAAGTQWHLNVAKTYRAPTLRSLLNYTQERSGEISNPDIAGNPQLRNETSSGLELGLTQQLYRAGRSVGQVQANLFARRIHNSQIHELQSYYNEDWGQDRWRLIPVNRGTTRALGLEAGVRYDLPSLPLTVHADVVLTQSQVANHAAPKRLNGQAPLQLNMGWDAHTKGDNGLPDQWGALLRYENSYRTRLNPAFPAKVHAMTSLQLHALWTLSSETRLRAQLLRDSDWRTTAAVSSADLGDGMLTITSKRPWQAAIQLERDF